MSKAPWFMAKYPNGRPREKKRVNPISKSRAKRMAEYRKVRAKYLKGNAVCGLYATRITVGCTMKSSDVHHSRGRVSNLLTDVRYFIPVCRACHDWIGNNVERARKLGLICSTGLWNKPDKTPHATLDPR